jgi:hypothetical protein
MGALDPAGAHRRAGQPLIEAGKRLACTGNRRDKRLQMQFVQRVSHCFHDSRFAKLKLSSF